MVEAGRQELTQLLQAWSDGDKQALEKLVPHIQADFTGWRDSIWLANARTIRYRQRR